MGFYDEHDAHVPVNINGPEVSPMPPAPSVVPAPIDAGAGFYGKSRAFNCVNGRGDPEYDALVDLQARAATYARNASVSATRAEAALEEIQNLSSAETIMSIISEMLEEAKSSGVFNGQDGQSAYEAAVMGGYAGTESDFYADLGAMDDLVTVLSLI